MENQENKTGNKNGKHHSQGHKHHGSHHGEECCSGGKCCGSSCCSGHKVGLAFLVIVGVAALLLIGFSWGARMNYGRAQGFEKGWMMDGRFSSQEINSEFRGCGCRGLNTLEPTPAAPAPTTGTDSQTPLE